LNKTIEQQQSDFITLDKLYKISGNDKDRDIMSSYIDLTLGTRVRVTRNICIELGIFNGAMGTIIGFSYTKKPRYIESNSTPPTKFCTLPRQEREIPIVFVQLDCPPGFEGYSCHDTEANVYPFHAVQSRSSMLDKQYCR
jgi:hypothetical protein